MSFRGVKRRGNPLNRNATQWRLPLTALVLSITTAQKIFAIKIRRIRNRTAVSQDCLLVGRTSCANGTALRRHIYANNWRIGNGIAYKYAMPRAWLDYFATTAQIAQTALRLRQPTRMSFIGAKRRGNPLNRIENKVAVAIHRTCSHNFYRAENLCYQFEHG